MTTETKSPIDALVEKFLRWKLPASVCADPCAVTHNYPHDRTGTNLLSFDEAKQMFLYLMNEFDLAVMHRIATARDPLAYASVDDLRTFARQIMQRPPDYLIGDNYIRRWWVLPRNEHANIYIHEILSSDDDRALHDHPWDNTSIILEGGYIEHTPNGAYEVKAGCVTNRAASAAHRLEVPEGGRALTLFITGPKVREWGFHCPQGWRHWKEFCEPNDSSKVGKGCE